MGLSEPHALWIGLACLAITAVLAVRVAHRIPEPLRQWTREAQAIGRLELRAKTEAARANVTATMTSDASALNEMFDVDASRLAAMRNHLPDAV